MAQAVAITPTTAKKRRPQIRRLDGFIDGSNAMKKPSRTLHTSHSHKGTRYRLCVRSLFPSCRDPHRCDSIAVKSRSADTTDSPGFFGTIARCSTGWLRLSGSHRECRSHEPGATHTVATVRLRRTFQGRAIPLRSPCAVIGLDADGAQAIDVARSASGTSAIQPPIGQFRRGTGWDKPLAQSGRPPSDCLAKQSHATAVSRSHRRRARDVGSGWALPQSASWLCANGLFAGQPNAIQRRIHQPRVRHCREATTWSRGWKHGKSSD